MTKKVILITSRWPRNRTEKRCYGSTNLNGSIAEIFVNKPANKRPKDLLDTVYHELTHAIVGLYKTGLSGRREERLCSRIGKAAMEAFKDA